MYITQVLNGQIMKSFQHLARKIYLPAHDFQKFLVTKVQPSDAQGLWKICRSVHVDYNGKDKEGDIKNA